MPAGLASRFEIQLPAISGALALMQFQISSRELAKPNWFMHPGKFSIDGCALIKNLLNNKEFQF